MRHADERRGLPDRRRALAVSKRARIILGVSDRDDRRRRASASSSASRTLEPRLHEWVTDTLSESLESEVQLGAVHLNWFPLRLHARRT